MNEQQRAVVQQALEAINEELAVDMTDMDAVDQAAEMLCKVSTALRQLLEQPEPVQEPKFAPYWAVTDMKGKHIKVNTDTQRLEIYEEKCWARANVRSNTKAMLVYITKTPPAQPAVPLTDEQVNLLINGKGDEGDDDYVEPTGDGFGLTDEDLVKLIRRVEAHHGIGAKP
jgi:hypothetical protein